MSALYNEINPEAAEGLRLLIAEGLVADGEVYEGSISDVQPSDLDGFTQCHFFAGIGGWSFALRLAGWPDDRSVWTGSCPCQPFSAAGKRSGFSDARHLWPEWSRLVKKCKPPILFGEQSAQATEWLAMVRRDLEAMDYAVGAMPIEAASAGARHRRDRFWFVADAEWDQQPREEPRSGAPGRVGRVIEPFPWDEPWESALSRLRVLGDGLPRSVGAADAARNAIVPQVAAKFIAAYLSTPQPNVDEGDGK